MYTLSINVMRVVVRSNVRERTCEGVYLCAFMCVCVFMVGVPLRMTRAQPYVPSHTRVYSPMSLYPSPSSPSPFSILYPPSCTPQTRTRPHSTSACSLARSPLPSTFTILHRSSLNPSRTPIHPQPRPLRDAGRQDAVALPSRKKGRPRHLGVVVGAQCGP